MKNQLMKLSTVGLSALLGTFASLSAIERPAGEKTTEEIPAKPARPQGGILRDDQKVDKAEKAEATPKNKLKIIEEKVAYLGVGGLEASEALLMHLELESGLLLSTIDPASPAGLSGLKENDIIVAVGETKLTDQDSLRAALLDKKPGDEVALEIIRRGKSIEQKITLGELPDRQNIQPRALIPNQAAQMNQLLNQQLGNALGGLGDREMQKELMEQLNKAFGDAGVGGFRQLRLDLGAGDLLNGNDLKMNFQQLGSMRFEDEEGSIEMKMSDGQRELSIRDKEGTLLFEGPYDTDIDKAAVPEEYKERVERLDTGNGSGFQFKLNGKELFGGKKKNEKKKGE
jgi:hypothetical protein